MAAIKLIVGLGNPGADYAATRHNVGAWLVSALADQHQQELRHETKFHGNVASITVDQEKCQLLIPSTYMNESGLALIAIAKYYKIVPQEILIVHDELDIPPGQIRFKKAGGHGGHNGLRDILHQLHNEVFYRLRIGIGHPGHKDKVTPYVLGKPSRSDYDLIQQAIQVGLTILPDLVSGAFDRAIRQLTQ